MSNLREFSVFELQNLISNIKDFIEPAGFECYPFKVGWYNSSVSKPFQLPYDSGTIAIAILSLPKMFENTFLPYLCNAENLLSITKDPLDQCMLSFFKKVRNLIHEFECEIIHDFELTATRRPKIIMQTVGHVSGAARYYQRKDLGNEDPWDKGKNIMGVCLHSSYGGWFAFRGVVILKNFLCRDLQQQEPVSVIKDNLELLHLLQLFNENWKDGRYRDVIPVKERYSNLQKLYFDTAPSERPAIIKNMLETQDSPKDQGKGTCREAFFKSLKNLGTDYIDLYLIHWPGTQKLQPDDIRNKVLREESWNDLEELYLEGKIKAIGVSNFTVKHLKSLLETCRITPHVNQVELHPHFRQDDLTSYCIQNGICIQAYSSLGTTTKTSPLLNCPVINGIATQIGKSNAQVLLKWAVQKGFCVIPKSTNPLHIAENIHLDFELNSDMLEKLSTLTVQSKYTWDPSIVM